MCSMPVLVIRLELQLGKVCFMLGILTNSQILFVIFFKLFEVICANADILCAYRYLQEQKPVLKGMVRKTLPCTVANTSKCAPEIMWWSTGMKRA